MSEQLEILLNISGRIILILLSMVAIKTQILPFSNLIANYWNDLDFFWVYAVGFCWSSYEFISVVILWDFLVSCPLAVCLCTALPSSSGLQWHQVNAFRFASPPQQGAWNSIRAFYLCVSFNFCYLIFQWCFSVVETRDLFRSYFYGYMLIWVFPCSFQSIRLTQ